MSGPMDRIWFDGTCGMCTASVGRMQKLLRRRGFVFEPFPSDSPIPDELKLDTRNGRTLGGADPLIYICRRIWWAWPMWALAQIPRVMPLFRAAYSVVARNRYRVSGACSIRAPHSLVFWILTLFVASVWIYHGLFSKLLHVYPRHLLIVQSVPGLAGDVGVRVLILVGTCEVLLGLWVLSGVAPRIAAIVQTFTLLSMNVIELTWARAHLLWPAGLVPVNLLFLACAWIVAAWRAAMGNSILFPLKRHPIPITAHFRHCLVLTFAFPEQVLRPLLPPGLTLDTYDGFGFLAIAMVQTESLRPEGAPPFFGQDFFLTGYRIFSKFRVAERTLRGLRILRSDANRRAMVVGGNLLTHYNYRLCTSAIESDGDSLHVRITTPGGAADLDVTANISPAANAPLPDGSPFRSLHDALRFAGPLPWTFDYEQQTHSIIAIKGMRRVWKPRIVPVTIDRAAFLEQPPFASCKPILASAFYVADLDYRWLSGVRMPLREVS
jgi:predicted DCC family thiol-disulfide oxidoreductase YuxK/uncharacterized membrane protein YphA (DoxX/SURF4 family)